jgi:hypothetical protein
VFSHSPQLPILMWVTRRFYSRIVGLGLSLDVASRFKAGGTCGPCKILHK